MARSGTYVLTNVRQQSDRSADSLEPLDQPAATAIRASLDRLIARSKLRNAPQLANFLRYVVEQTVEGNATRLKAYTIATDALGRDAGFDADNDPIVRVAAGRLRRTLEAYYMDVGGDDPVIIELPRGSYVPAFRPNSGRRRTTPLLRWKFTRKARENFRLVMLIVVVATLVSLSLNIVAAALGNRIHGPAIENAQLDSVPDVELVISGSLAN